MSQPGIGAMIHHLCGGQKNVPQTFYGRKIVKAEMLKTDPDRLVLTFSDGTGLAIYDDGQSCCESRYMTCDDDLSKLVGGTLTRLESKEGPDFCQPDDYGEHEQVFIEVGTDECFITVCTHNEHNGYYGGFGLTLDAIDAKSTLPQDGQHE